jgi:hypothetical protein
MVLHMRYTMGFAKAQPILQTVESNKTLNELVRLSSSDPSGIKLVVFDRPSSAAGESG